MSMKSKLTYLIKVHKIFIVMHLNDISNDFK